MAASSFRYPCHRPETIVMSIVEGDLFDPAVIALLGDHLQGMAEHSPPQSVHALDVDVLKAPDVTFWRVLQDDELCGCSFMTLNLS